MRHIPANIEILDLIVRDNVFFMQVPVVIHDQFTLVAARDECRVVRDKDQSAHGTSPIQERHHCRKEISFSLIPAQAVPGQIVVANHQHFSGWDGSDEINTVLVAYSGDRDRSFRSIVTGCAASKSCAAQIVFSVLRTAASLAGF